MANRTRVKQVRLTEAEAASLSEAAQKEGITESEYIRVQILDTEKRRLPKAVLEKLTELNHQVCKIGNNINQVVRICNEQKHITRFDFVQLIEYEKMLVTKVDRTYQLLENLGK